MPRLVAFVRRFGLATLVAIGIVVAFASGMTRHLSLHELRERREALLALAQVHPLLAALAYLASYSAVIALSLPVALPMTLMAGLLFGAPVGGLLAATGCTLGGIILFLACRTAAGDILRRRIGGRMGEIEDGVKRDAFFYILTLRLLPFAPFGLATVALGFLEIPLVTFVVATFVGILPISFIYATIGSRLEAALAEHEHLGLQDLIQPQIVVALIALAILALAPIAIRLWRRRARA